MVIETKSALLKLLRDKFLYTGDDQLASVKSFLTTSPDAPALVDANQNPLDIDQFWAHRPTVTVGVGNPEIIEPETPAAKSFVRPERKPLADAAKAIAQAEVEIHAPRVHINAAKSLYKKRINSGEAVFGSVDEAEAFGAWMRQAIFSVHGKSYGRFREDSDILGKALGENVNTAGGVLVPDEFKPTLIWLSEPYGVTKRLANVQPMVRDSMGLPRMTSRSTWAGVAEGGTIGESDPGFDFVQCVARKSGAIVRHSSELGEDSAINVSDALARQFVESYERFKDASYILGDGTATYNGATGLANSSNVTAVQTGTGTTWGAIVIGDFTNLIGSVENVSHARCAFLCSRQFFYQVMTKLDVSANQFKDLRGNAIQGADASFLGMPVFWSQDCPTATAATQRCCYYGDFAAASIIGDRRDFRIDRSDQAYWTTDQIGYRATARFAINIHGDGRGSTFGPLVALRTN